MDNIKLNSKQTAIVRSLDKILEEITAKSKSNKLKMEPFSLFCKVDKSMEGSVFVNMEDFEMLLKSDTPNSAITNVLNIAIENEKFIENFNIAIKDSFLEKKFTNTAEITATEIYNSIRRLYKIIANAILSKYTSKKNEMTDLAIEIAKSIASCYSDLLIFDDDMSLCIEVIDKMKKSIINNCSIIFSEEETKVIEKYLTEGEKNNVIKKFYNYNKKLEKNDNNKPKLSEEISLNNMIHEYESALETIKKKSYKYRNLLSMYKKMCNNINNSNLVKRSLYNYILTINDNKNNKEVIKDFMTLFMDGNAKHPNFIKIISPTLSLKSVDKTVFISELADKGDFDSVVEILSVYIELSKVGDLSSTVVKNVLNNLVNCMVFVLDKTKTMVEDYDISIKNFERFIKGLKYGNKINFVKEERFVKFNLNAPEELKDDIRTIISNMISYAYTQNDLIRRIKRGITDDTPKEKSPKKNKKRSKVSTTTKTNEDDINQKQSSFSNITKEEIKDKTNNETIDDIKVSNKLNKAEEAEAQPSYVIFTPDEVTLELQKLKNTKKGATITKIWIIKSLKKDGYEVATKKLNSKINEIIKNKEDYNDILLLLNYFLEVECEEANKESYYDAGDVIYYTGKEVKYIKDLIELMNDCSDYIQEKTGMYYDGVVAKEILDKIEQSKKRK